MKSAPLFAPIYKAAGVARIEKLAQGLPATAVNALAEDLILPMSELATFLGMSPRTLRTRTKRLTADEAQRSFRAFRVLRRATDVLGDETAAREWLKSPQRALADKTPLALLSIDLGVEEVLNLLGAIDEGSYL